MWRCLGESRPGGGSASRNLQQHRVDRLDGNGVDVLSGDRTQFGPQFVDGLVALAGEQIDRVSWHSLGVGIRI
jgi:hypothetical protein